MFYFLINTHTRWFG